MAPTLLVPVDLTPCASRVVAHATRRAAELDASLLLLHVVQLPTGVPAETWVHPDGGPPTRADVWARTQALTQLRELARVPAALDVHVSVEVTVGEVVDAVVEAATRHAVDVVVMGSHGRSTLSRWVLGSVGQRLSGRLGMRIESVLGDPDDVGCGHRSCAWCSERGGAAVAALEAESAG